MRIFNPKSKIQNPKWKGFTLIELLVVVAIIAVLISLLLPALSQARENGKALVCSNSMRQLGMITFQYMDDYNDRFPEKNGWNDACWITLLAPYISLKDYGINGRYYGYKNLVCPCLDGPPDGWYSGFAMNFQICFYSPAPNVVDFMPRSVIAQPERTVMYGEITKLNTTSWPHWDCLMGAMGNYFDPNYIDGMNDAGLLTELSIKARQLHLKAMNITFADGHVLRKAAELTVYPENMWDFK